MASKKYYVTVDEAIDGGFMTCWHKDAKYKILHRENGPAVEYTTGDKFWYQNGQMHRTDGPAVIRANGNKFWFINGEELTEAEFLAATQPVIEMTVADVEKLLGKRVKIVK